MRRISPFFVRGGTFVQHRSHQKGNLLAAFHYNKIAEICAASHPFSFGTVHWNKHRSHKEGNLLVSFQYNKKAECGAESHAYSFGGAPEQAPLA